MEGSGDEQEGNGAHREALASTVRDQMTRASAHNNGLFTLRSDPIPIQASNPSLDTIEDRESKLMVNSWPPWPRDGFARDRCAWISGFGGFFEFFDFVLIRDDDL